MSFPRYPKYKDSGVEWLGEVPEGWEVVRVRRLFEIQKRIAGEEGYVVLSITQQGIKVKDIESGDGQLSMDYSKYQFVEIGDFAMNQMDLLTGYVDIAKQFGVTSPDYRVFRLMDTGGCLDRYYLYLFQNAYRNKIFFPYGQGSAQLGRWRLPTDEFYAFFLPRPPVVEQKSIADFLDRETAKIDALVAEQENLIALLKEKRQAVISHAVTKGLVPTAPMKDSGIEWLGEVPRHWDVVPLMHLTNPSRPIMYGIVLPGPNVETGIPIVKGGDVKEHRLKLELLNYTTAEIEAPYARARLKPFDIVYSIRGTIGDAEVVPLELEDANITQDVARISPANFIQTEWLLHVMKSKPVFIQLEQRSLGAAVRGINIFELKRARIPVPPTNERAVISAFLDTETAKIDTLTTEAQRGIELLKERRSALISAAVTGKIDVREVA